MTYLLATIEFKDFIAPIATIIAALLAVCTYLLAQNFSKKKMRQDITLECIKEYRAIFESNNINEQNVKRFINLINEELFYIKKDLIVKDIREEWIESWLNFLPIFFKDEAGKIKVFNQNTLCITNSLFKHQKNWKYLFAYPRLRRVFFIDIIKENIDYFKVSDSYLDGFCNYDYNHKIRKKVVGKIMENLLKKRLRYPILELFRQIIFEFTGHVKNIFSWEKQIIYFQDASSIDSYNKCKAQSKEKEFSFGLENECANFSDCMCECCFFKDKPSLCTIQNNKKTLIRNC